MSNTRIRAFANSPNSQKKAKDAHFRAFVARGKSEKKISETEMAKRANVSRQTFLNYKQAPEKITLGVLRSLRESLGLTPEDLDKII